jgi:hypothetical protein
MRRTAGCAMAAAMVTLLLGACTGQVSAGDSGDSGATATATTVSTAPCRAADLALQQGPRISPLTGEHGDYYLLVNRGKTTCELAGYPGITLEDASGTPMKFRYTHHSEYVTTATPRPVALRPGTASYVLVAKYRCDTGSVINVAVIQLAFPGPEHIVLNGRVPDSGYGVSVLSYCKGGPDDPGQLVAVSPIAATIQAASHN